MNLKHRFIKTSEHDNIKTRIAELGSDLQDYQTQFANELRGRKQAEADLDAVVTRRCEGCEAYNLCSVRNAAWVRLRLEPDFPERGFCCNRWVKKVTP